MKERFDKEKKFKVLQSTLDEYDLSLDHSWEDDVEQRAWIIEPLYRVLQPLDWRHFHGALQNNLQALVREKQQTLALKVNAMPGISPSEDSGSVAR